MNTLKNNKESETAGKKSSTMWIIVETVQFENFFSARKINFRIILICFRLFCGMNSAKYQDDEFYDRMNSITLTFK